MLIGENFTFKIKFKNLSTTPGYGPFIDLVLDAAGADAGTAGQPCDGVRFVSARLLTGGPLPLGTMQQLAPCPTTISSACVPLFSHPFGAIAPLSPVGARAGSELQTIILPFGHYEATQPELEIEVTARVSLLADANVPLSLSVRGGFRYGNSPTGGTPIVSEASNLDSCSWTVRTTVNPTVMKVGKRYLGPELEAASGPNFVSYYPLRYALTNDIAAGQTITNLVMQDLLPPTLVYHGNLTVTINGNLAVVGTDYTLVTTPPVTVSFLHPITGSVAPDEVVVTFEFWIPLFDSQGTPILGPGCAAGITNILQASGDWAPVDVRDVGPVNLVAGPVTNLITAKCLAVQKTVRLAQPGDYPGAVSGDSGPAGVTPGDLLRYEINFQISDYKTIGDLVLTDWLGDGQVLDVSTAPFPQLTVQDQFGIVQGAFNVANFGTAPGQAWRMDPNVLAPCTPAGFPAGLRADRYTFNISQLMMAQAGTYPRHAAGILTGGIASFPFSATPGPAVGTLVFYARVADRFIYPVPGDSFVDKHDPLVNCVVIQGTLFPNVNAPAVPVLLAGSPPVTTSDDSGTGLRVVGSPFTKTIYAVNGLTTGFLNPPHLAPGHTVTFRLTKSIPSGDAENVVLRDFPPLPVLKVADPAANGSTPWTIPASPFPPLAGQWSVGPGHTAPVPGFSVAAPNELTFTVGSFNNPLNTPLVVDVYFTMRVSGDPIADGLFLTNEALEREENSFHETFAQVALAQIKTAEPNLRLTKGVVATDDAGAVFTRPGLGALVFSPPGTAGCPRFSGAELNSATLPAFPQLTSDICHLRTNARVTFAIVVENLGSSPFGAFDITILDTLPACFREVQNICITAGAGANLAATGDLFTTGLNLTDVPGGAGGPGMGALGPYSPTSGRNIAVITFDATYVGGCCANHAQLLGYSNKEGGSNFVTAGLVAQASDDAGICCDVLTVNWPPDKTVQCGSAWTFGVPVALSSCSEANPTITILSTATNGPRCSPIITRTWQVTDACLNTTNHVQTVTVVDTTPPVLTCVAGKNVQCGDKWVFDAPTASDACSGTNVTITVLSTVTNGTACAQQFTRTWLVVDACGNTNTCSQTVTIVDTTPPIFVSAPGAGTGTGTTGTFSALAAWQTAAGTTTAIDFSTQDNGNPITPGTDTFFASLLLSGAEFVNVRSYYNAFIYVGANAPIRVNLPPGTFSFGADLGLFYPAVGGYSITLSDGQVLAAPYTGQDFFGFVSATPIAWVEFRFTNSGVLLMDNFYFGTPIPAATGPAEKTVLCGTAWTFDAPTAYDVCGGTNVTITVLSTVTNGPCPRITRAWAATDACGNSSTISQTVIIVDTTPPTLTCAPEKTVQCGTVWRFDPPVVTDGCSGTNVTLIVVSTVTNGSCPQVITRTWQAVDPCGNKSTNTCSQTVTVVDTTSPGFTCTTNKTVQCGTAWSFDPPTAFDACSGTNVTVTIVSTVTNGTCPQLITRTWQAVDPCGNKSTNTCSQTVTVVDTTPPVLTCAPEKTVQCGTAWSFNTPTAVDACSGTNVTVTIVSTVTNGTCPQVIVRTWRITDACGNSAECAQMVTVVDTTPPLFTCPTNKTVQCGTVWSFNPPTTFDACSGTNVSLTIVSTVTNGTCPQIITRTWRAVDACGNPGTNTCSQTVTVVDTLPPQLLGCQNLSTNSLPGAHGNYVSYSITAVDTCPGPVTLTCLPPSGSFFPVGTNLVLCTAVDACGNTSTCEFTVTVTASVDACLRITDQLLLCRTNGGYSYTFTLTNQGATSVAGLVFVDLPAGVTLAPTPILLAPPLAPGQGTNVTATIATTGCAPTKLCFRILAYDEHFEACCVVQHCLDLPACCAPRTYTLDADFAEGYAVNLNYTNVPNQLQINSQITTFPYVWIASGYGTDTQDRGSVMKLDALTGVVLGEYRTAPAGNGLNPSRTTVDRFGNCWVANRNEASGGQGSVARVALLIGGTRVDAAGNPSATGQYLKPPFAYNSGAIDRDNDGLIKTSMGLNDRRPWAAGTSVATAEDEAITLFLRVPGTGARSLAVDRDNNLWVGGYGIPTEKDHQKFDSVTGLPLSGIFNNARGGYGAVIDRNGILWSAGRSAGLFRMDTLALSPIPQDKGNAGGDYGLSIDPCTDNLWHTAVFGSTSAQPNGALGSVFVRGGSLGAVIAGPYGHGHPNAQGVCVDQQGNVFVAHSILGGGATTVGRLTTSGCYVGNIPLTVSGVVVGRGPTGVAVGHDGKIWVSCYLSHDVLRIDPNSPANGFGTGCSAGIPKGAVDLVVDLNANGGPTAWPYNYSDETGFHMLGSASPGGFWNVIRDGCHAGLDWGTVSWNSLEPAGTSIKVEVRASDTQLGLASQPFTPVGNSVSFCGTGITGRHLEIRVSFYGAGGCNAPSPILYDLTVDCSCVPTKHKPVVEKCPDSFFTPVNNASVTHTLSVSVADADGDPLTVTWSEGGVVLQTNLVPAGAPGATTAALNFTHTYGPGQHVITILVNDGTGGVFSCTTIVQIGDSKGPLIITPTGVSVSAFTGVIPDFLPGLMVVDDHTPTEQLILNQRPLPGMVVGQGVHLIELTARDLAGNTSTSQTFYAVSPVVRITAPVNYATFTAPATINVATALAADVTGVARIRLLNGGAVVGTNNAAPYGFAVSNLAAGTYLLTAQAVSITDLLSTSDGVIIDVLNAGGATPGPTITGVALTGRSLTFSLLTEPGVTFHVEYTETLSPPAWMLLRSLGGDGSVVSVTDANTNAARRFYRVRRQ